MGEKEEENDFWRCGHGGTIIFKERKRNDKEYNKIRDFTWFHETEVRTKILIAVYCRQNRHSNNTHDHGNSQHTQSTFWIWWAKFASLSHVRFFVFVFLLAAENQFCFYSTLICNVSLMRRCCHCSFSFRMTHFVDLLDRSL